MPTFEELFPHLFDPLYMIPNFFNLFMAIALCLFFIWYIENHIDDALEWFFKLHGKEIEERDN